MTIKLLFRKSAGAMIQSLLFRLPFAILFVVIGLAFMAGQQPSAPAPAAAIPQVIYQVSPVSPATTMSPEGFLDGLIPHADHVWFFIFIAWYIFSAITSGMPEPTLASSPWYIWAYRSFHILTASGTSFFQNKLYWPHAGEPAPAPSTPTQEK